MADQLSKHERQKAAVFSIVVMELASIREEFSQHNVGGMDFGKAIEALKAGKRVSQVVSVESEQLGHARETELCVVKTKVHGFIG